MKQDKFGMIFSTFQILKNERIEKKMICAQLLPVKNTIMYRSFYFQND